MATLTLNFFNSSLELFHNSGSNDFMELQLSHDILSKSIASFNILVESHVVKKNGRPIFRRGSKAFIGKSDKLVNSEFFMQRELRQQMLFKDIKSIDFPVHAIFRFHFPKETFYTKKGKISRTLPDLSNLYELPQDCLQKAGVIENDTLIHSHDLSRRIPSDKYLLEIHLLKFNELGEKQ